MAGTFSPTGKRTDDYGLRAQHAGADLTQAIGTEVGFLPAGIKVVEDRGYPTFTIELTEAQAEKLADFLRRQ